MKKIKSTNLIAMVIGAIGIAVGLYELITGSPFREYFFSLFIGISLLGTAYINNSAWTKEK
ncbi:hypothetical protein [Ekhidna sp.]|uniref:hypothetical protein n=1 Tax=Ekhidna sp. TaxID=2608089 RepID=UPI00329870B1